jgi:hypothetical protein
VFFLTEIVFGLAVFNGNLLNVRFPQAPYKTLPGFAVNYQDLKDFDGQLFNTLEDVLSYERSVEDDMGLAFEYDRRPICSNGETIRVTNGNRREYRELLAEYLLVTSVNAQFSELRPASWSPLDRWSWTCSSRKSWRCWSPDGKSWTSMH